MMNNPISPMNDSTLPLMPGMPGMEPMPGMPGMPGMEPVPGMPGVPGMQPMPGMPGMPGMQPMPGMPGMPGMQPMPGMPGMPGMQLIPGMPGMLPMPGMPGMPGMPFPPSTAASGNVMTPSGQVFPSAALGGEQSYIENILRMNLGKTGTFYMTYENNSQWNAKIFRGVIEAAGRDHLIISDSKTGQRIMLLMVNFDYATFDEPLNYTAPGVIGSPVRPKKPR